MAESRDVRLAKGRERARRYREGMSEQQRIEYREYQRAYRERNAEQLRGQARAIYWVNRERRLAQVGAWQSEHASERTEYLRAYRDEHHERLAKGAAAYKRKNKDRVALWEARRRASKRLAPINDLTLDQWTAIKRAYHHRCTYCGIVAGRDLTVDHVIPISHRGPHTARNVVPACLRCNARKNDGPPLPVLVIPVYADLVPAIWDAS